jgi:uncharacterized protein with HEPN domain
MPHHEDDVRIRHMLDSAREAVALMQGKKRGDLDSDRVLGLALARLLEIIGEAAACVSEGMRKRIPAVPWTSIVGLRNRLIHGYDSVDMDIIWTIIHDDLPALVAVLEGVATSVDGEGSGV